ncbi:hypothetical protein BJY52DRAFT_1225060 [Lactarius psammicola]|nr:hypothetical protein BJY52DRAFT_1225060 [Lactarius psammicola]
MAPRTRKSKRLLGTQTLGSFNGDNASLDHSTRTDTTNEVSVISPDDVQHISDWTPPQDNLIIQPNPKKPRNVGEAARQPQSAGVNKGRGKRVVQPSPSFYPGRTYDFGPEPSFHPSPKDYDSYTSTEDDSANEEDVATLQGRPDKAHMAIALELLSQRPTWLDVVTTRHPTPVSKTASTETVSSNDDTSLGNNSPTGPMLPPGPVSNTLVSPSLHQDQQMTTPESSSAWPADTNLLFTPVVSSLSVKDYKTDIQSKLRARIPLFHSEVKERCNIIAMGDFLSMARADIVRAVEWQCSNYHYMFPRGPILYASIYEWRTGTQQAMEFSANSFFDVYQGHVSTLQLIKTNRGNAFHKMMADIYSQADTASSNAASSAVMAQLDLDQLE